LCNGLDDPIINSGDIFLYWGLKAIRKIENMKDYLVEAIGKNAAFFLEGGGEKQKVNFI